MLRLELDSSFVIGPYKANMHFIKIDLRQQKMDYQTHIAKEMKFQLHYHPQLMMTRKYITH